MFTSNERNTSFVFPDKETASYFYHDLELLSGEVEKDINEKNILFFPSSARKAYPFEESDSFHVMLRTHVLKQLSQWANPVIVTYAEALIEKVLTSQNIVQQSISLRVGEEISMDDIMHFLSENGFEYSDYVFQPGQYAVRGGIMDVFSYADEYPYRIEFSGDTIKSLRMFDTESQASKKMMDSMLLMPDMALSEPTLGKTDFSLYSLLRLVFGLKISDCVRIPSRICLIKWKRIRTIRNHRIPTATRCFVYRFGGFFEGFAAFSPDGVFNAIALFARSEVVYFSNTSPNFF